VGEVLLSLGRWMRGASDMRASDLMWQIEQTGPRSLPIVALVSFLVGLIVAYMGAAQLQRFGAQTYIADLVTVGVVREVAALLVGIVLAGRVGAAFAAQIGSMRANEEIDALTTLGVNPFDFLVLPRVLALLIVGPMLTAFGALVGMGVGWLVAVVIYGVTPLEYVYASVDSLTLPHVLVGLIKGTVYAVLVALAGCLWATPPPHRWYKRSSGSSWPPPCSPWCSSAWISDDRHCPPASRRRTGPRRPARRAGPIGAGARTHHGLRRQRGSARPHVRCAARRGAGHRRRQRLRQEHADAPPNANRRPVSNWRSWGWPAASTWSPPRSAAA